MKKKSRLKLRSLAATFANSHVRRSIHVSIYFSLGPNRESINQFMCACGLSPSIVVIYAIFIQFMWCDDENRNRRRSLPCGWFALSHSLVIHPMRMKSWEDDGFSLKWFLGGASPDFCSCRAFSNIGSDHLTIFKVIFVFPLLFFGCHSQHINSMWHIWSQMRTNTSRTTDRSRQVRLNMKWIYNRNQSSLLNQKKIWSLVIAISLEIPWRIITHTKKRKSVSASLSLSFW